MINYLKISKRRIINFIRQAVLNDRAEAKDCFTKIAGVSVFYDRFPPPYNYGTRGKPYRFYAKKEFIKKLNICFEELWNACPYGHAQVITSAGAYVDKPGWHGKGMAFDLDGIFWETKGFVSLNYSDYPKFYLGINSIFLKHFGTVLNYNYNSMHKDHFHIQDDGLKPKFREVSSIMFFLQPVLREIFNQEVSMNGSFDSETKAAIQKVFDCLEIDGEISNQEVWLVFLTKVAEYAFKVSKPIA